MSYPEDERLAQLVRALRRQHHSTQAHLAAMARVPLNDVKAIEAGRAEHVELGRIRRVLEAQDGRARLVATWNGAAGDSLVDRRHAEIVEHSVRVLRTRGWQVDVEVSFSEFGERGSIDVLGCHPEFRAVAVCEVKTAFGSLEETNRVLDVKERLAPTIVFRRVGWRPRAIGRLLILPRTSANRGVLLRHQSTMDAIYPARTREVRAWLHRPGTSLRGIWLVAD